MKKICIITVFALCAGASAMADDQTSSNMVSAPQQNSLSSMNRAMDNMTGKFGVGVTLGEPIGGSLKYFFSDNVAIDGALGWSSHDHSDIYLHSDILWHDYDLIPVSRGRLPVYFGVGGLFRARNDGFGNQVGIRVPVGLDYLFDNAPVDIFAEIGPALDVSPYVRGEITGGAGVRFWF